MGGEDLLLVFSNATGGRDEEFNEWYDSVHVPDVLGVPGVLAARRYEVADLEVPQHEDTPPPAPPVHRYLAVYRLSRDANEVMQEFLARMTSGQMVLNETLDLSTVGLSVWSPRGSEVAVGGD
jgi:hypothetical protein